MADKKTFWQKVISSFLIQEPIPVKEEPTAYYNGTGRNPVFTFSFDGQKNLGEMGPVLNYELDYDMLRYRSWQSQLESDVCKTIIDRYITWLIGSGLKLQSEPETNVLKSEGIELDKHNFSTMVESRYGITKRSLKSDYSEMKTLDKLAKIAKKNAIVGGDVLVIKRFDGKNISTQIIDGCHIASPSYGSECMPTILDNGNRIINGIELDSKGKHVAYYVNVYRDGRTIAKYERIEARSKSNGLQTAFLVYGSEHRLNNVRGLPLLAAILETAKKMERYKEATLGSAEEVAKIVYQVVHQVFSDGSNPLQERVAKASGFSSNVAEMSTDALGQAVADKVAATTNKTAINMPKGAELKSVKNENTNQFKDFYAVNSKLVCATIGMPYAVAFSDYDGSYSSSRAGIKDWEHTLNVGRDDFGNEFYQKDYEFWLDIQILLGKIQAPGYLLARKEQDEIILCSYRKARWVGQQVPHIDPLVEVKAERLKLGAASSAFPLTTLEAATERLDGGEVTANIEQFAKEMQLCDSFEIEDPKFEMDSNDLEEPQEQQKATKK